MAWANSDDTDRRQERQPHDHGRSSATTPTDFVKTCTSGSLVGYASGPRCRSADPDAPHPGGDGRPPPALLPGPARDRPTRRSARSPRSGWPSWPASTRPRCARTSRTWAPTAPGASATTSSYLLHEITPGARPHPRLAGRDRRRRQPRRRRSPTTGASAPAASGSWRSSTPTRRRSASRSASSTVESLDDLPEIVARARASPSASSPPRRTPPRRSPTGSSTPGVTLDPQLRADGRDRARPACRCARSTSPSSCRSSSFYQQRRAPAPTARRPTPHARRRRRAREPSERRAGRLCRATR